MWKKAQMERLLAFEVSIEVVEVWKESKVRSRKRNGQSR